MAAGDIPRTIETNNEGHGTLPPERFSSASEVSIYCNAMITADNRRSGWRSEIDGQINGNQPVKPGDLKAKQLGWYPNINYRGLASKVNSLFAIDYDLVTESDPIIDIDLDWGQGEENETWAEGIERNFTWLMMTRWRKEWNYHLTMQLRERIVHGLGIHVRPMPGNNWIPRTPKTGLVLFPEESPFNFAQDGEGFMVREYVPLHTLYGYIRNESAATKLGWNCDLTWKAMAETSKAVRYPFRAGSDLEVFQANMKRGDLGYSTARQSGLWLNYCYVRELDSYKKSLYIVAEGKDYGGYLFKRRNCFDDWPIDIFPFNLGQGTLHSVRGIGADNKDFYSVYNRVNNAMLAQVILATTVQVQQTGSVDPDKLKLLKLGVMSLLPQGVTLQQGFKFQDLGQGPLALMQHLQSTQSENNESYSGDTPEPKDRETGMSFQMRAQDSSQANKGNQGLYCSNLRHFYDTTLRMIIRAAKEPDRGAVTPTYVTIAKEFMARCRKENIPMECFDHIVEIREVVSTGSGSPSARIQALTAIMQSPVYMNAGTERQINLERDWAAATTSGRKVDRYVRSTNDGNVPNQDDSMAAAENGSMIGGGPAVVSSTQDHVKHAQSHLQQAMDIVQQVSQGQMEPEKALAVIQEIGKHTSDHLKEIQNNPAKGQELQQLNQELQALSAIADKLQSQIDEKNANQAQNPQQQISDNLQIGLAKVQGDHQIKTAKLASETQLKTAKTAADISTQFRKTQFDNRIKMMQAQKQKAA